MDGGPLNDSDHPPDVYACCFRLWAKLFLFMFAFMAPVFALFGLVSLIFGVDLIRYNNEPVSSWEGKLAITLISLGI